MPSPFTTILEFTLSTYTLVIGIGILAVIGLCIIGQPSTRRGAILDVGIVAIVVALVGARAEHVLLHWAYFGDHPTEITRLQAGGLGWHGALAGAWLAIVVIGRMRGLYLRDIAGTLAIGLPMLAFVGWWGCGATACAYGAEVDTLADYPLWVVWEAPDIYGLTLPRFRTQPLGMGLSAALLLVALLLTRRGWSGLQRLSIIVGLMGIGMFMIGFLRGDSVAMFGGLRGDQWFDLLTVAIATAYCIVSANRRSITRLAT